MNLSNEQQSLLSLLLSGRNVYFTGSGKTIVLKQFIEELRKQRKIFAITVFLINEASTGVAAASIHGQTIHSFSSIPFKTTRSNVSLLIKELRKKKTVLHRYLKTETLILDEASMLQPDYFDLFNIVCKELRGDKRPFGGIQMVIVGDFFQLPPVSILPKTKPIRTPLLATSRFLPEFHKEKFNPLIHTATSDLIPDSQTYLFESQGWFELIMDGLEIKQLSTVYRQDDPLFLAMLDDIRMGVYSTDLFGFAKQHGKKIWDDGIKPTHLSVYRSIVDQHNSKELEILQGDKRSYQAIELVQLNESQRWNDITIDNIDSSFYTFQGQQVLHLKKGAQVILVRNIDLRNGLANGSRGVVVGFEFKRDLVTQQMMNLPVVRFLNGKSWVIGYHDFSTDLEVDGVSIVRRQIPLKLGWGITIHKSQGMTLDRAIVHLGSCFAPGHAYVALSRVKSLEGLSLNQFSKQSLWTSDKVKTFYTDIVHKATA